MCVTTKKLCVAIPDVLFAYTFDDEISLVIHSNKPWLSNSVQNIISVASSLCSGFFIDAHYDLCCKFELMAFEGKAWFLPKKDIYDYFQSRQEACIYNSITKLAEMHLHYKKFRNRNKSFAEINKMLLEKKCNWMKYPIEYRLGVAFYKKRTEIALSGAAKKSSKSRKKVTYKMLWYQDAEMPLLSKNKKLSVRTARASGVVGRNPT